MVNRWKYIVFEGSTGVGKTTLGRRLAKDFSSDLILEGVEENPFSPRLYDNPKSKVLTALLFFLFKGIGQIKRLSSGQHVPIWA